MLRCRILLSLAAACCLLGTGRADEYKNGQNIPAWGEVVDPDGDCAIREEQGKLTVIVPGTPHDLSPFYPKINAPRILKQVNGDFEVQVKVTGEFQPGKIPAVEGKVAFNGAGLLIWQDSKNHLRLERNIWTLPSGKSSSYPPLLEYTKDGNNAPSVPPVEAPFFKGPATWLKLQRRGDTITASMSHDGKEWIKVKDMPVTLGKQVKVGVAAVNTSKQPFKAQFEQFQLFAR